MLSISTKEEPTYKLINWKAKSFVVIHRMAIAKKFRGTGISTDIMKLAIQHVKDS
jgi:predicted GNAT family N-acyltransferase